MSDSPKVEAFEALYAVVERMVTNQRTTRIAGVKPEMQRHLLGFDERRLGYKTFAQFVEAAAAAHYVTAITDDDGFLRALPANAATQPKGKTSRLRQDVWLAFTRWGEGWIWLWDRATSRAVRLPTEPRRAESPDRADLRASLASQNGAVVPITPIPMEEQRKWMEEFVAGHSDFALAGPLKAALEDERPFRAFSLVLKADQSVRYRFDQFRLGKVMHVVRTWAAEHKIDLNVLDQDLPAGTHQAERQVSAPAQDHATESTVASLRRALHHAIDEMSTDELRRISVPIGYVLDVHR